MKRINILLISLVLLFFTSCNNEGTGDGNSENGKLIVVSTTTMVTDLLFQIGGDKIELNGLMGPGVDPHLYKASEGDVTRLFNADLIFYNGIHLEGKMTDLFEKIGARGKKTFAISSAIPEGKLILIGNQGGHYDPHIWFSVDNWKLTAGYVTDVLVDNDSINAGFYHQNLLRYLSELDGLGNYVQTRVDGIPGPKRVLITAHDAFEYFGREYGFEVIGLQGISTVSEAGAADVKNLAEFIFERKIPAVFIESSVSKRNIEALIAAVHSRGFDVKTGGELFSDALGSSGTPEETYTGMYKHNIDVISDALK
nr:zinc ABC transporter substrate-binding protein [Bacteroidota bacterium]